MPILSRSPSANLTTFIMVGCLEFYQEIQYKVVNAPVSFARQEKLTSLCVVTPEIRHGNSIYCCHLNRTSLNSHVGVVAEL